MTISFPHARTAYYGLALLAALGIVALAWTRYRDFVGTTQALEQESAALEELYLASAECRLVLATGARRAQEQTREQTAEPSFSALRLPPTPSLQELLAEIRSGGRAAQENDEIAIVAEKLRAFDSLASLRRAQLLNAESLLAAASATGAAADEAFAALYAYRRKRARSASETKIGPIGEFALYSLSLTFVVGLVIRRLRRETQLANKAHVYLQSLLNASTGIYIIRTDMQGNYTYANRAFLEMFVPPEKRSTLLGSFSMDYIIPEDHEKTFRAVEECISYGGAKPAKIVLRKPNIHGDIHINEWEFWAIKNAGGEITEIQCAGIDRTEERLSAARFRTAIEANLDAVYLLQCKRAPESGEIVDFIIRAANDKALKQVSMSREQLIGFGICELFPVNKDNGFFEQYKRVVQTQTPMEQEYSAPNEHAPSGWYYQQVVPMPESDGVAIFNRDITDRKRAAQAIEAKNRELEHYLYVTSHDLRAPLVNIQGFSQRLERQAAQIASALQTPKTAQHLNPEQKTDEALQKIVCEDIPKALNFIVLNVAKMDALLTSILQMSRLGRTKINVQRLDVRALVQATLESFAFQLEEAGARVHVQDDLPDCYGDSSLLNQAFSNLVANAIKYRDSARPLAIEISARALRKTALYIVQDNGVGIPEEFHDKIWDVFYRVDGRSGAPGEGIGLSAVKTIVEKHHGSVAVRSRAGEGSSFILELPTEPFVPL